MGKVRARNSKVIAVIVVLLIAVLAVGGVWYPWPVHKQQLLKAGDLPMMIRLSPDGRTLAVLSETGIQLVDVTSGQTVQTLPPTQMGNPDKIWWDPNGRYLLSSSSKREQANVFEPQANRVTAQVSGDFPWVHHQGEPAVLLLVGKQWHLLDPATGKTGPPIAPRSQIMQYDPEHDRVVYSVTSNDTTVASVTTGIIKLKVPSTMSLSSVSPDGRWLLTDGTNMTELVNLEDGSRRKVFDQFGYAAAWRDSTSVLLVLGTDTAYESTLVFQSIPDGAVKQWHIVGMVKSNTNPLHWSADGRTAWVMSTDVWGGVWATITHNYLYRVDTKTGRLRRFGLPSRITQVEWDDQNGNAYMATATGEVWKITLPR